MTDVEVTPDGSPVPIYLAIPAERDFAPVLDDLYPGASVLDLGCGVGRLANELARRGHEVVGVDESAEMLAHLAPGVEGVQARIEQLDLGRRFSAVVLASHLVNTADRDERRALLLAVARHLAPGGSAYLEHWNPAAIDDLRDGEGTAGEVTLRFRLLEQRGASFDAAITYVLGEREWTQHFTAEVLDEDGLDASLAQAGLERFGRLDEKWLLATH
ncbi:class I SAM-dependent methyltransferase [Egicoccus halophilus]|uniref:Methyltransferase n=1 Tax=Egicoccus halophilus TaxID=1670830 RepID=A0A8J3AC60_9ACTN|nr:class I SAM-dependent methyltransferase [Egicoccus halophilus]GGI03962.1 methyltransferase [Egicoccus halophilus]